MCITVGRFNLKYAVTEFHDRNIECTATKVEYGNLHILVLLVKTISEGSCSRLVDDTLYIKTGNLTCLLGSLTL